MQYIKKSTVSHHRKESKIFIAFHYFLIYCAISFGGMALPAYIGNDLFQVFILTICGIYIFLYKKETLFTSRFILFLAVLFISMLVTVFFSTLSIGSTLSIICTLMIIYTTIHIDKRNFLKRFLNIIFILAIISFFLYSATLLFGFSAFSPLLPFLSTSSSNYELYSYGGFLYRFVPLHIGRNCGPFGEPGQYQCLLAVALYFSLFKARLLRKQDRIKYIIVFTIVLLTTQSTSGYISLCIIIICFAQYPSSKISPKIKKYFTATIITIVLFIIITPLGRDFITTAVFNKIYGAEKRTTINLSQGTAGARTQSIQDFFTEIEKEPLSLMGIGYDEIHRLKLDACAGLHILLLAIGILPFSILFGFTFWCLHKGNKNKWEMLCPILLIINMGLGQPHIMNPGLFIMAFYSFLALKKQ